MLEFSINGLCFLVVKEARPSGERRWRQGGEDEIWNCHPLDWEMWLMIENRGILNTMKCLENTQYPCKMFDVDFLHNTSVVLWFC